MVVTKRQKSQVIEQQKELVEQLQVDARTLFYDRMMYEVNDSLTSILAVCDIEAKNSIPKIKQHINKINESLKNTKNYQSSTCSINTFNATLVLKNLARVIRENYKDLNLISFISDIKAPTKGDQSKFEQIFLYLFITLFLKKGSEVLIELKQKDKDAMITLVKNPCSISDELLEEITNLKDEKDFYGGIQINTEGKGIEVVIKLPLQFKVVSISKPIVKKSTSISKKHVVRQASGRTTVKMDNADQKQQERDDPDSWELIQNRFAPEYVY